MYQTDCKQNHDNKIVLYQYLCVKHIQILLEIFMELIRNGRAFGNKDSKENLM
jgi:hypothetical protein